MDAIGDGDDGRQLASQRPECGAYESDDDGPTKDPQECARDRRSGDGSGGSYFETATAGNTLMPK